MGLGVPQAYNNKVDFKSLSYKQDWEPLKKLNDIGFLFASKWEFDIVQYFQNCAQLVNYTSKRITI